MRLIVYAAATLAFMGAQVAPSFAAGNPQAEGLTEQIVETTPREGVYQRSLLSRKATQGEKWLVVSFPGYPGILRLAQNDGVIEYQMKGNFLVRARRHLVSNDIAVATLDCPSDQFADCGDSYRAGDKQVRDVEAQIEALKAIVGPQVKVALIGTSYGTVSTEILALKMGGKVDAVIHTSSITRPLRGIGRALYGIDLTKASMRQLLVHHQDDPCDLTPFSPLEKYQGMIPIMRVKGQSNPHGPDCQAFTAHGFVGREREVMNSIGDWLVNDHLTEVIE
ncbi:MAG: alpha/beta hydrolase [Pseudomonadota bacterium]